MTLTSPLPPILRMRLVGPSNERPPPVPLNLVMICAIGLAALGSACALELGIGGNLGEVAAENLERAENRGLVGIAAEELSDGGRDERIGVGGVRRVGLDDERIDGLKHFLPGGP